MKSHDKKTGIYRVRVNVRGRNAFNALIVNTYECKVKDGKILSSTNLGN